MLIPIAFFCCAGISYLILYTPRLEHSCSVFVVLIALLYCASLTNCNNCIHKNINHSYHSTLDIKPHVHT